MPELTVYELEIQHGEMLPERETLGLIDVSLISAIQTNVAKQVAAGFLNQNAAAQSNSISVYQ